MPKTKKQSKPQVTTAQPPMQPLVLDANDVIRFQKNQIIVWLFEMFDPSRIDLDQVAAMDFEPSHYAQLLQLLGYSVDGFLATPVAEDPEIRSRAELALREFEYAKTKKRRPK